MAKLDSSGALKWNTFLGGSRNDCGYGIAVDSSGNVYISGNSGATWQGTSPPVRAYTAWMMPLPPSSTATAPSSGIPSWGAVVMTNGYAIAVDSSGNVYVGGSSDATWQGSSPPVRAYTLAYDAFAAKLDSSGALQWNTFLGGSGNDHGMRLR